MISSAVKSLHSVSTSSWWHTILFYDTAITVTKPQDIPALN